jgi:arylsulfatase A-like enzyme
MPKLRLRSLSVLIVTLFLAIAAALVAAAPSPKRPTIVLISIDTLRADHLSAYGYARKTSPFIDSVAAKGLLFERAVVAQPQTSPSHASLLTGVTPWKHGVITNGFRLPGSVDTLAAALRRAGYDTAGVVAVPFLGSARGYAAGFNRFAEPPAMQHRELGLEPEHRRDANQINADAKRTIDVHLAQQPRAPLFLFVHYFDCHYPYRSWDPAENQSRAYIPEEKNKTARQIQRYDDGIAWTDRHIEELVKYARAKLGNDIVLVITADHGEQLGDHGLPVGHADIYRETVHVPLIVAAPGYGPRRIETRVSTLDVPVTLARLGGARLRNALDGLDLFRTVNRETSWRHQLLASEERAFVIMGAPTYTRSVALVKGSKWFIKNFDHAYRDARIETPAPPGRAPANPLQGRNVDGQMSYTVNIHQYRPFWVTFEHRTSSPACAATALTTIDPGIAYYLKPTPFKGSIRITVPAARVDAVTLSVTPANCAGVTRYEVTREAPPGVMQPPDLFNHLVARKLHSGDELYDVTADPLMRRNLPGADSSPMDKELQSLFEASARQVPRQRVPNEYLETLRSLGYI